MRPADSSLEVPEGCDHQQVNPRGCDPQDSSPYGVMDTAGSVLEWVMAWPEGIPAGPISLQPATRCASSGGDDLEPQGG